MSPQTKKRTWTITITGAALISAVAWGGQLVAPVASVASSANQHWVPADTFRVFRDGLSRKQFADSMNLREELRDFRGMLANLDSSDRCRRGLRRYCR